MLHQKHESYRYILPLKDLFSWISTTLARKNVATLKMYIFFYFMTTFHNLALKIETSWERVIKPFFETRNAKMIFVCLFMVYSF